MGAVRYPNCYFGSTAFGVARASRGARAPLGSWNQPNTTTRPALAKHGITCSMSRKGDYWDNAVAESFFATLKPGW
jgi:hypothetical protein